MSKKTVRFATPADAAEILSVYEPYVRETDVTFEIAVPKTEDFCTRIKNISADYPYLVCECEGEIIGYAYAAKIFTREAYRFDAELSVYITKKHTCEGIGGALLKALLEILKLQNIVTVYSIITSPNIPSEQLHEKLGFKRVCTFEKAGYKFDSWHDDSWYEKKLLTPVVPMPEFISIKDLPRGELDAILKCTEQEIMSRQKP